MYQRKAFQSLLVQQDGRSQVNQGGAEVQFTPLDVGNIPVPPRQTGWGFPGKPGKDSSSFTPLNVANILVTTRPKGQSQKS